MSDDQFHTLKALFHEIRREMREGFSAVDERLDGMKDAVLYMADHGASSVPGTRSPIRRGVRKRIAAGER